MQSGLGTADLFKGTCQQPHANTNPPVGLLEQDVKALKSLPSQRNLLARWPPDSSFGRVLLGRVKGRALPAAQSLLRKLDQVPGDKAHAEDRLDLTTAQRVPGRLPERCSVVGYNPDSPDNIPGEHSAALQIDLCQLAFCRQAQSVRIGCVNLIAEAGEKPLRRVGVCDRAAPARQHFGRVGEGI